MYIGRCKRVLETNHLMSTLGGEVITKPKRRRSTNRGKRSPTRLAAKSKGFASGFEMHKDSDLKKLQKKLEFEYDYEPDKLVYTVPAKEHTYTPDFKVALPNGKVFYLETKGKLDLETRQKHVHIKRSNPGVDIRFVFQRDNLIRRGAKSKYSDWCKKHGFLFSIGHIPKEWFEE